VRDILVLFYIFQQALKSGSGPRGRRFESSRRWKDSPFPITPGNTGSLPIFYGNGTGTFQAPVYLPISRQYTHLVVADLNRDNKPDLVMTDGATIAVMMNLGGRQFDSEIHYVAGRSISRLDVVDVNGDGFPDIVAANPGGTTVTVLLNQPNGISPDGSPVRGIDFRPIYYNNAGRVGSDHRSAGSDGFRQL
jgi:hypothetical protein